MRTDAAGATHGFTARIHELGMQFSVGAYLHQFDIITVLLRIPASAWTSAYNADGKPHDGAWVTEITGMTDLAGRHPLILCKERPHPGPTPSPTPNSPRYPPPDPSILPQQGRPEHPQNLLSGRDPTPPARHHPTEE